jgi:hypothetical protein
MALTFYPHPEDMHRGSLTDSLDTLMAAAEQYKAAILDPAANKDNTDGERRAPRDLAIAYNWEAIASILRDVRELPEGTKDDKMRKGRFLTKLSEIYEILRSAKMPKLEAVRLALVNEAKQLSG